jgi:glycerol-3-phosphate acyltransferase PlsX
VGSSRARIGVDAMGGDDAPHVVIQGLLEAVAEAGDQYEAVVVGDEEQIKRELSALGSSSTPFTIVHAPEKVEMGEPGLVSIRKKRNSSITVLARLVQKGELAAMVSAGNTGAVVAAAYLNLGRIERVERPAIATFMPNQKDGCVVLDVGANSECRPINLLQFAVMGGTYARRILGRKEPRIGLLNIGEESSKGNELAQEAHKLLAESAVNFVGNVEGKDIFGGSVDVVVCDGFTGNVVLKFTESVIDLLAGSLREHIRRDFRSKMGALLLKPAFQRFKAQLDYAEYGGAPLLGVNGICIIAHGSSSPRAIKNAIKAAASFVHSDVNEYIKRDLKEMDGKNVRRA